MRVRYGYEGYGQKGIAVLSCLFIAPVYAEMLIFLQVSLELISCGSPVQSEAPPPSFKKLLEAFPRGRDPFC
jgi:hypothetical protein